jgi:outer membrane receptor protein involved in Fe transport
MLGNLSMSYASDAYWQDVLDSRYHGYTDAFTLVNGTFGYKITDTFTASIKVLNLFDQEIQQHIFGDVMRRQAVLELRMRVGAKP